MRNKSAEHIQVHESLIKFNTLVKYLYFLNDTIPKKMIKVGSESCLIDVLSVSRSLLNNYESMSTK